MACSWRLSAPIFGSFFDAPDYLGKVLESFTATDGWGLGSHSSKSSTGDYTIVYEINYAPLPDLAVSDLFSARGASVSAACLHKCAPA
jgi:hypothetical protein